MAFRIVIKSVKVCTDMTNTSYNWGYYHTIANYTIYVRRGTTSTVYFICKSRTNKTGSISRDTRSSRRQRPKDLLLACSVQWYKDVQLIDPFEDIFCLVADINYYFIPASTKKTNFGGF